MTFTKLHDVLLDSSIWNESDSTRIVWITMLAMADQDGVVHASVGGLAHRARVSEKKCRVALVKFMGPDSDSRDKTTGERIEELPGGWLLLNHSNYRDQRTHEQVATATRVARHRAIRRAQRDVTLPTVTSASVTPTNANSPSEAEAEAEAEAEVQKQKALAVARPDVVPEQVWADFLKLRKAKRAPLTPTAWKTIEAEVTKAGWTLDAALRECLARGWAGFKAEWVAKTSSRNGPRASGTFDATGARVIHPAGMPVPHDSPAGDCNCGLCVRARAKKQEAAS